MEHKDQSQPVDMNAPNSSSPALRWVMRITLTMCGLMIVAVLLSQPRAKVYVQDGFDRFDSLLASFAPDKNQPEQSAPIEITDVSLLKPTPAAETSAPLKPSVMAMPTSRVPVRRLGLTREN